MSEKPKYYFTKIAPNGSSDQVEITPTLGLTELQHHVEGYIELVNFKDGSVFVVNEEGTVHNLPVNAAATSIARMKGVWGAPYRGTVLFMSREAWEAISEQVTD